MQRWSRDPISRISSYPLLSFGDLGCILYSYTVLLFRPYCFPFTRRADLVTEDAIIIQGGATCPLVVIKRLSLQTQVYIAGISSFLIFPNNLT